MKCPKQQVNRRFRNKKLLPEMGNVDNAPQTICSFRGIALVDLGEIMNVNAAIVVISNRNS